MKYTTILIGILLGTLTGPAHASCSLFEGVYKALNGHTATAFTDDTGEWGMTLNPGSRLYVHNGHCILPDCPSDSMVTVDSGEDDSFQSPIIDDTQNPPAIVTIKDEQYRFYCPAEGEPATM